MNKTIFRQRQYRASVSAALALVCVVSGGLYLALPEMVAQYNRSQGEKVNAHQLATAKKVTAPVGMKLAQPVHLSVPRLGLEKPILSGSYNHTTREWSLDDEHAFYATGTSTPLIYGHDIAAVFQSLEGVAAGEILIVTDKDGRQLYFKYTTDQIVEPSSSDVLNTRYENTVLLMTCTGPHFEKRRVLHFIYVGQRSEPTERMTS